LDRIFPTDSMIPVNILIPQYTFHEDIPAQ
jgi:hypothetical protein